MPVLSLGTDQTGNADTALQTIANQTLAAATPVAPGAVTTKQQQQLNALAKEGTSALVQYYTGLGLHAASFNPGVLVNSGILATQAQWSEMDTANALSALNLSSQDYNQYMLDQLKSQEQTQKDLMIAASIAATIFTGGAAAPFIGVAADLSGSVGAAAGAGASSTEAPGLVGGTAADQGVANSFGDVQL